jgi:tetratricopeptide (TPR) repeat protein
VRQLPAQNFGEAVFKPTARVARVEIDPDKLYPQLDYNDDVIPRRRDTGEAMTEARGLLRAQDFAGTERVAREILLATPRLPDARILLARALLGQNRVDEAEKLFHAALDEGLPTAATLAWANIGLGEIALKKGQTADAAKYFGYAVRADAEYGASLAARAERIKAESAVANSAPPVDESARAFVGQLDHTITNGTKAELDTRIVAGELTRFVGGIVGTKPEVWQTRVLRTEQLEDNLLAADVSINSKVLGKEQSGTAVFLLARIGGAWKLVGIELFEVR